MSLLPCPAWSGVVGGSSACSSREAKGVLQARQAGRVGAGRQAGMVWPWDVMGLHCCRGLPRVPGPPAPCSSPCVCRANAVCCSCCTCAGESALAGFQLCLLGASRAGSPRTPAVLAFAPPFCLSQGCAGKGAGCCDCCKHNTSC